MEQPTDPSPPAPAPPCSITSAALLAVMAAAILLNVAFLIWPKCQVRQDGDATIYLADPGRLAIATASLGVALATGIWLAIQWRAARFGKAGVVGALFAVLLAAPLWHAYVGRVIVTSDTLTAPGRGGLLPGDLITVRFDQLASIIVADEDGNRRQGQTCYTKRLQPIEIDLGPAGMAALNQIRQAARKHGVKIERR